MREGLRICDPFADSCGRIEITKWNAQGAQQRLGNVAALRLPWIGFAKRAAKADQHKQWDFIEVRERHDAVNAGQEPVVLHEHGRFHSGKIRARGNPYAFFFLGQPDQHHFGVIVGLADQVDQPGFRQGRHEPHARLAQRLINYARIGDRDWQSIFR